MFVATFTASEVLGNSCLFSCIEANSRYDSQLSPQGCLPGLILSESFLLGFMILLQMQHIVRKSKHLNDNLFLKKAD